MDLRRLAIYGSVSLATTACATAHTKPVDEPLPADQLALEVDNHNWSDVLIYIVHDGFRSRLVQVTAARSLTQSIPRSLVGSDQTVQFLAHRIGGVDDYLSPQISVRTGYTLSLTLESDLRRSSLGVW